MINHKRRDSVWKFMRVEMRVEMRLDLPFYPKHYFWIIYAHVWQSIYTHYDEEVLTKHIRSCLTKHLRWRSFDKTCTMKFRQNIYAHYDEEIMTKHIRRDSVWKFMRVEMRVEMRLDLTIYPKHYFWIIYAHVWQSTYAHYDE